ncbi:VanZ family protein [Paenalkalicoccus suaedae]|uniref:VanZ family protein n=1 Tax=Paenalkalicoccus suaedae TaxID=2592382 RepID=A0A859FCI4_9BACI|nr:VanZ family protein [Paenalkalicoccus suaedae]QKS70472.1 VanZ family protein [Paenalkalicoccus suaedae]
MLYFLYIGFGRTISTGLGTGGFSLIPDGIPLSLPTNGVTWYWFYNTANFATFIPFGLVLPLLVNVRFPILIGVFLVTITILELGQWATGLGIFDTSDILTNALGVSVGYVAQAIGRGKHPITTATIVRLIGTVTALTIATIVLFHVVNRAYDAVTRVELGDEI